MFEYLDASLSPAIQASVREHLGHCQACRKMFDEEQRFSGSLSALLEHSTRSLQIRPGLQEKVMLRVQQLSRSSIIRFPVINIGPVTRWALAAAACLLIASITAFLTWQHPIAVDTSSSLRSAMQSPVASLPVKQDLHVSPPQTEEPNWTEPSQSPLDAKGAKHQSQLAIAMATAKDRQKSSFASIEARQRHYIRVITQQAEKPNLSAAALETTMVEIKACQIERFAKIEAAQQGCFLGIAQRTARLNQSAADLEAAMTKIKARQEECFLKIKATQQYLAEKIFALQKPIESS